MGEYFSKFFDTSDFPARWYCGNWSEFLGWLHIVSDIATFGAYFAIPAVLIYFARRRNDFPFTKLFMRASLRPCRSRTETAVFANG